MIWNICASIWASAFFAVVGALIGNLISDWIKGDLKTTEDVRFFFAVWLCFLGMAALLPITLIALALAWYLKRHATTKVTKV